MQPRAPVGREHAVGSALPGQHLVAVEQRLVLVVAEGDARGLQGPGHAPVALDGLGLVVAVGQHLLHAQAARQPHDALRSRAMAHDQPAARGAASGGKLGQSLVQLQHAGVDELHAPVAARGQRVQDVGIEHEGTIHPPKAA
ncbi:oxidoreductase, SDR family protein [Alicycliphilus sp. B1]|nr:oxidoreductase, SDR family protein [Alicycliphilus sp. B1]